MSRRQFSYLFFSFIFSYLNLFEDIIARQTAVISSAFSSLIRVERNQRESCFIVDLVILIEAEDDTWSN